MFQRTEDDAIASMVKNSSALEVNRMLGQLLELDYEEFERGLSDE